MNWLDWLSLFGVCLLGAMSPGPSLAVVTRATLRGGLGSGMSAAVAHGVGVGLYGLITVAGLAVLIAGSPRLFLGIQVLGALYLIHLGIKSLRAGTAPGAMSHGDEESESRHGAAVNGFLVAFLNPKLAVFMLALFSQFLDAEAGATQKTIMVLTVGITDALWYGAIAALLSRPRFLDRLQANAVVIDRVFGVILIALALTVLLRAVLE